MAVTVVGRERAGAPRGGRADADDRALIDAVRGGDLQAYGELYRRHVDVCTRLARRLCHNRHLADDVVSEVFAASLNAIRNGHGPVDEFAPYALRSVRNQAARAYARGDGRHVDTLDPHDVEPLGATVADTGDQLGDHVLTTQAFGELPARFRQILWDTEVEGRSHAEIGLRLGLREPAVAALARRARNAFCRTYLDARANRTGGDPACRSVRQTLAPFVRGTLGDRQRSRVTAHLAECTECTAVIRDMERLDVSLRHAPWLTTSAGVLGASRWMAAVERVGVAIGVADLPKLLATCAVGLTMLTGPHTGVPDHLADPVATPSERAAISRTAVTPTAVIPTAAERLAPSASAPLDTEPASAPVGTLPAPAVAVPSPELPPGTIPPVVPGGAGTDPGADLPAGPTPGGSSALSWVAITSPWHLTAPDHEVDAGDEVAGDEVPGHDDGTDVGAAPSAPADVQPSTDGSLVELTLGSGLVELDLLGDDELAHLGLGDGLADVSIGSTDALADVSIGDDLLTASLGGDGGLVELGAIPGGDGDPLVDVNALGPDSTLSVDIGDIGVGVGTPGGLVELSLPGLGLTIGAGHQGD